MEDILRLFNKFDGETYLRALIAISKADGIDQKEADFINLQSSLLGIDSSGLWKEDVNFSLFCCKDLSRITKMAIIRDCMVLANLHDGYADAERNAITQIASQFELSENDVISMENWLKEYWQLLEKGRKLLED